MKNVWAFACIWALATGLPLAAEDWYTLDNGTLTFNVADGVSETYAEAIPSSVTALVKDGAGTVTLTGDNQAFTGTIEVKDGVLAGTSVNRFGPKSGTLGAVWVRAGATLDASEPSGQTDASLMNRVVHLAGSGYNDQGAFRRTTGGQLDTFFGSVTLDADATIHVAGNRIGIGSNSPSSRALDMGGHTLTLTGAAMKLVYCKIVNPGHIVQTSGAGTFVFQNDTHKIDGDATNSFTLTNGTTVQLWGNSATGGYVPWSLVSLGTSTFDCGCMAAATLKNFWTGPVRIEGSQLTMSVQSTKERNLTVTGDVTASPSNTAKLVKSGNGVLWLKNNTLRLNDFAINTSDVHIENADVTISNNTTVGSTPKVDGGYMGTLTLSNTVWRGRCLAGNSGKAAVSRISVPGADSHWGTLTIDDHTIISNDFHVAYQSKSFGAVYQRGASSYVWWPAGASNDGRIGNGSGGYGYWGLTDGTLDIYGHTSIGLNANSQGFLVQHGGLCQMRTGSWKLSKGGYGEIYADGGATFTGGWNFTFGSQDYTSTSGGTGIVTCAGSGTRMTVADVIFHWRTNFVSQLNINDGGTFTCDYFALKNAAVRRENLSHGWISFNGGTFAFSAKSGTAGMDNPDAAPECAYVQAGGATISVPQGAAKTWCAPLLAPTGQSLASITLPAEVLACTNYIGPAHIQINGRGEAATALMAFEDVARAVKGVRVTAPGSGYGDDTTVEVEAYNRATRYPCAFTLRPAASGGVEKAGDGTLTITCMNTYAGATRVSGGQLVFTHEEGYPGGDAEFPAATLIGMSDVTRPLLKVKRLAFRTGAKVRVTGADVLDSATFGKMRTIAESETALTEAPALELVNADNTVAAPREWKLFLSADGRTLQFGPSRGTVVIVR